MTHQYANSTTVPVAKSRAEIDSLLRRWGCDGIRWTDQFREGIVSLEFIWEHESVTYAARMRIALEDEEAIRGQCWHSTRYQEFLDSKFEKMMASRGKSEHRILLLWLKASFNAVDSGIVKAEALFLPFLMGNDGRTLAEVALPRLPDLLKGGAMKLLGDPKP